MANEYQWSEAFQRKLLALYVREPRLSYAVVEPEYFTNPMHVDIATLVKKVYNGKDRADVRLSKPTMMSLVKGSLGKKRAEIFPAYRREIRYLFEDGLKDRTVIMNQAVAFAKQQKFRLALVDAEKDVNIGNYDRAINRFSKLKGFGTDRDIGMDYWKDIKNPRRWSEDREGIVGTFYFKQLDHMMGGGLGAGELGIILAGGKVGKSTLIARFAAGALWQGMNAAIATGELSEKKYRKRIDAMFTVTPTWKLTKYSYGYFNDNPQLIKALNRAQKRLQNTRQQVKGQLWIKQWPTNKGKVSDIENWLDQLKEDGHEVDILFVDYVRVFKPSERYDEQRLSIGAVCMDLRGIAVDRNIPVWTAAQTNRAALTKERVGPEDMAEDISQFWTLDFLIALCQTESEAKKSPQRARLLLSAARDVGQGGLVDILIQRETFRVWEANKQRV
jgi:hypothetical protein